MMSGRKQLDRALRDSLQNKADARRLQEATPAERRTENREAAKHMAHMVHTRRVASKAREMSLATTALHMYPLKRYPDRSERFGRCFEWIFTKTKPRKGHEMATDRQAPRKSVGHPTKEAEL